MGASAPWPGHRPGGGAAVRPGGPGGQRLVPVSGELSEFALCRPGGGAAVSVRLRSIPCRPCPVRQLPPGPAGRRSPVCGLRHRRRRLQAAGPSGGLLPFMAVSGPCRPLAAHPDAAVSGPGHGAGPGGGAGRPSDEPFSLAVVGAAVGHGASVPASVRDAAPVPAVPPPAQKRLRRGRLEGCPGHLRRPPGGGNGRGPVPRRGPVPAKEGEGGPRLRPGGHGGAQRSEGIRRGDQPGSGLCRGSVPCRRQSADPSVPAADGRSGQLPL